MRSTRSARPPRRSPGTTPTAVLMAWLHRFYAYFTSKRFVAAALLEHADRDDPVFGAGYARVVNAGRPLLRAAQESGEIRTDLTLEQILDMIAAIAKSLGIRVTASRSCSQHSMRLVRKRTADRNDPSTLSCHCSFVARLSRKGGAGRGDGFERWLALRRVEVPRDRGSQPPIEASWCRWSLVRLCVTIINRHSVRTAAASSVKPGELAVVFGVSEHRLDGLFAFVGRALCPARCRAPGASSCSGRPSSPVAHLARAARVRRDQHADPMLAGDVVHVLLVPVAGVGERDLRPVADAGLLELSQGGVDHRSQVREVDRLRR